MYHPVRRRIDATVLFSIICLGSAAGLVHGAETPNAANPAAIVDALNGVFGKQTYGRAIHAKGIVLEGVFTPDRSAATLSKAPHLAGADTPVTVRFSSFAGIPAIADADPLATPRGLAIKFHSPKGDTDIVAHSFNGFPSPTAEDFRQLMIAIGTSPPGAAAPTPADTYMSSHPTAKAFFAGLAPPPVSFATTPYFGVNSFKFTNAKGHSQFARYQFVPVAGAHYLNKEEAAKAGHDYLEQDIQSRVAAQPVQFTLRVQLSAAGDIIDNPAITWPDSRPNVVLGVIKITRVVADSGAAERQLMFSPAAVTDGIETADPMIAVRQSAYAVSFGRRHLTQ
jgi:catalase